MNTENRLAEAVFEAYFDCRKNKRNTLNALKFEKNFESNLFELIDDLKSGNYEPRRSIAFIVTRPVKREIFAADFRDRIVHHLLINRLTPLFEQEFIFDSYSCRVGKGTHFGIRRINDFITSCSQNYSRSCYILKLDIRGFFMHINRKILYDRLQRLIRDGYRESDRELVIGLCRKLIFNDPVKNCIIKGSRKDWEGLPANKSLFHSAPGCGLPIGNLTSQVFANFYLHPLDRFIQAELGIEYYGRYVDDFVIIHPEKDYLKAIVPEIDRFLSENLRLCLHPDKQYLQHYSKGVGFLGAVIKPGRMYIGNRTKGNFCAAVQKQNAVIESRTPTPSETLKFLSCMNSYLGIMRHFKTYNLRRKIISTQLSSRWWRVVCLAGGIKKFRMRKRAERGKSMKREVERMRG